MEGGRLRGEEVRAVRRRAAAGVSVGLIGLAALGASLAAVEGGRAPTTPGVARPRAPTSPGIVRGRVLAFSPVSGWFAEGDVTIAARSHGALVRATREQDGHFVLPLPPGAYVLSVRGTTWTAGVERTVRMHCWADVARRSDRVLVEAGRPTAVTLRCPLPPGAGALG